MRPLRVGEVNNYIKKVFATDIILSNIEVEGEISNYNNHYSGHRYFSLKDDSGRLKCVMFKSYGDKLEEELEEGQKVIAKGYVSVYEKNGEYQLYVQSIKSQGVGDLYQKYEELKKKLEKEGLFSEEYKKAIPTMPKRIGIVTSATGAAIQDMTSIIHRRFPATNILIYPSLVQGDSAAINIAKGIRYLDDFGNVDLIIIGRGGGSIEELFAFNDEHLARTIFSANTPIISAVGHETDFTIADFVADLRAATPSAAAELAVPNLMDLQKNLVSKKRHLTSIVEAYFDRNERALKVIGQNLKFNSPMYKIRDRKQELDMIFKDLNIAINRRLDLEKNKLLRLEKNLELLNPSLGLDNGLGILLDLENKLIKSIDDIEVGKEFNIMLKDGEVLAVAKDIRKGDTSND